MRIILVLALSIILCSAYVVGQGSVPEIRRVDNILEFLASRPELKAELEKKIEEEKTVPKNAAGEVTPSKPTVDAEASASSNAERGAPKHRFNVRRPPQN